MNKTKQTIALTLFGFMLNAQTVSDFENFNLSNDSYLDAQGADSDDTTFTSGNAIFTSNSGGGYWSGGWAVSNKKDTTDGSYNNLYSAITASGYISETYAVGQNNAHILLSGAAEGKVVSGVYLTNTTYAALVMEEGNGFSKKFGGDSGTDPDWCRVTIKGYNANVYTDSVDAFLADFRSADAKNDYILNDWLWVDLTSLGNVDSITFSMNSSDVGQWGMNTPAFFSIDNLTTSNNSLAIANQDISQIKLYPNPANHSITITNLTGQIGNLAIFDIHGHLIYNNLINEEQELIDISDFKTGIYFVKTTHHEGSSSNSSFIKR